MKKIHLQKWLSLVLCLALLAAAALSTVAFAETATEEEVILMTGTQEDPVVVGEGELNFFFQVVDAEGVESWFLVQTDQETVGAALVEAGLVAGDETEYGLMVTSVCGIEVIWSEENPRYWALFINDEYAQTGVDSTPIEDDTIYTFKVSE